MEVAQRSTRARAVAYAWRPDKLKSASKESFSAASHPFLNVCDLATQPEG